MEARAGHSERNIERKINAVEVRGPRNICSVKLTNCIKNMIIRKRVETKDSVGVKIKQANNEKRACLVGSNM